MGHPTFIVSNQKREFISECRVNTLNDVYSITSINSYMHFQFGQNLSVDLTSFSVFLPHVVEDWS